MWNFKGTLWNWNSKQNILPIHWNMCCLKKWRFKSSQIYKLISIFEMPHRYWKPPCDWVWHEHSGELNLPKYCKLMPRGIKENEYIYIYIYIYIPLIWLYVPCISTYSLTPATIEGCWQLNEMIYLNPWDHTTTHLNLQFHVIWLIRQQKFMLSLQTCNWCQSN